MHVYCNHIAALWITQESNKGHNILAPPWAPPEQDSESSSTIGRPYEKQYQINLFISLVYKLKNSKVQTLSSLQ
jgi:hypothetical protein